MINELVMLIILFAASILLGLFFLRVFKWKPNLIAAFVWGLSVMIALFHIIAYPLFIFRSSFILLFWIYTVVILCFLVISAVSFIKHSDHKTLFRDVKAYFYEVINAPFMYLILIALISALIYTCVFCYHPTSDDGYYLARSMEVIANNSLDIHSSQSWYGETISNYPDLTDASTLSFFISYLSYLFDLPPAIICRRGFAFLMIVAHLLTLLLVYDVLTDDKRKCYPEKAFFLIVYILFQMISEKVCSSGRWLTSYIWQGKAILMALILPLLLVSCINIIKSLLCNHENIPQWFSVCIVLTAGISVSTVGLFLPLILFFSYGIAFLMFSKFQHFKKVLIPALLSALPVIICGIVSYLNIATENMRYFQLGKTPDWSWIQQFFRANDVFQFSIFILGLFFFAVKGSVEERIVLCLSPLVLFATFLCPLFAHFVSKYVTTAEVYWRLFWILPVYIVPALALTRLTEYLFQDRVQVFLISISAVFFLCIGFQSSTYYTVSPSLAVNAVKNALKTTAPKRMNSFAVSEEAKAIVDAVLHDWEGDGRPHLLSKYDDYCEIRQCTSEIVTFWPEQTNKISGMDLTQSKMVNEYDHYSDTVELYATLKAANVDYLCLREDSYTQLQSGNLYEHLLTVGKIVLWKVK